MHDSTLFETIRSKLFTAVVGDVLDVMGYRAQFLPQAVKPLEPGTKLVGRAMPVLEADYPASRGSRGPLGDCAFGMMLEALDDLRNGEIYLATGGSHDYALWGGLMSARARHLGAAGAILDGFVRDRDEIRALDFPVFARGTYAQDQAPRGKVIDFRVPLRVGQAMVEPGDLLFGDEEGIIVIPRAPEVEVIEAALAKAATENAVAAAIRNGMSAREAFDTFGVL